MPRTRTFAALLLAVAAPAIAGDTPSNAPAIDPKEAVNFRNHLRLTSPDEYFKAGEAYFDHDGQWIVFQAVPADKNADSATLAKRPYSMYVASLRIADGRVTGINTPIRISNDGSANTCGWFHPTQPSVLIFGSTLTPFTPSDDAPGFSRARGDYKWDFPTQMKICRRIVQPVMQHYLPGAKMDEDDMPTVVEPIISLGAYSAECSFSKTGRFILYTFINRDTNDPDIAVFDTERRTHTTLVSAKGYDGGPFFSPDNRHICYRSDRTGDGKLQLFIAELKQDDPSYTPEGGIILGAIRGIKKELPVTANDHVNWAPFWHPSGHSLVYTTSEIGHDNYEVFAVEVPLAENTGKDPADLRRRRLTYSAGFDGLPAFSSDAKRMLWTSQRPADAAGVPTPRDPAAGRIESQVWIADVIDAAP